MQNQNSTKELKCNLIYIKQNTRNKTQEKCDSQNVYKEEDEEKENEKEKKEVAKSTLTIRYGISERYKSCTE